MQISKRPQISICIWSNFSFLFLSFFSWWVSNKIFAFSRRKLKKTYVRQFCALFYNFNLSAYVKTIFSITQMTLNIKIQLRGLNITEEFFGAKWRFFPSLNWFYNWDCCTIHSAYIEHQVKGCWVNLNDVIKTRVRPSPFLNTNLRTVYFSLQFVSRDFDSSIWVSW